jgi:integrase
VWTSDQSLEPSPKALPPHPLAAGLPRLRFHDLRHTAATLLLEANVNTKVVSEMLGHSEISVTMDLYQHVTPTMQQQAADAFDALLSVP